MQRNEFPFYGTCIELFNSHWYAQCVHYGKYLATAWFPSNASCTWIDRPFGLFLQQNTLSLSLSFFLSSTCSRREYLFLRQSFQSKALFEHTSCLQIHRFVHRPAFRPPTNRRFLFFSSFFFLLILLFRIYVHIYRIYIYIYIFHFSFFSFPLDSLPFRSVSFFLLFLQPTLFARRRWGERKEKEKRKEEKRKTRKKRKKHISHFVFILFSFCSFPIVSTHLSSLRAFLSFFSFLFFFFFVPSLFKFLFLVCGRFSTYDIVTKRNKKEYKKKRKKKRVASRYRAIRHNPRHKRACALFIIQP